MANIKLLADRVLILVDVPEDTGFIIPDADKLSNQGEVVAVGPDVKDIFLKEKVIFGNYGTSKFILHGVEYILTTEEYIIGKI